MQSPSNFLGQRLRFFQRVAALKNPPVAFVMHDLKRLVGFGIWNAGRLTLISRCRLGFWPDDNGRSVNGNRHRSDRNGRNRFSLAG